MDNIVAKTSQSKIEAQPRAAGEPASADRNVQPTWRRIVPPHHLAEMPPLPPEDLKDLIIDVAQHGIRNEVTIYRDKSGWFILDGCNRLDAAEQAGLEIVKDGALNLEIVPHRFVAGNTDLKKYVRAQNVIRRHLNAERRHYWAEKLLKDDPSRSDRAIAKQIGIDSKTVATDRRRLEACAEIPRTEIRTDTGGRQQPVRRRKASNGAGCHNHNVGEHHGHEGDGGDHHDHVDGDREHIKPAHRAPAPADDPTAAINKALAALSDDTLFEVLRPHIQRLGREGLCRAMSDELKTEFSDHIIKQGLRTASTRSPFAKDSSSRLHTILTCAERPEPSAEDIRNIRGAALAILRDAKKHNVARSNILIAEGGRKKQ